MTWQVWALIVGMLLFLAGALIAWSGKGNGGTAFVVVFFVIGGLALAVVGGSMILWP